MGVDVFVAQTKISEVGLDMSRRFALPSWAWRQCGCVLLKECAKRLGVSKLAPHDLRRSCARLCHESGGELEQIQFLLGHMSVQTTEKYLGCKQRFRQAVNDRLGIEPPSDPIGSGIR